MRNYWYYLTADYEQHYYLPMHITSLFFSLSHELIQYDTGT